MQASACMSAFSTCPSEVKHMASNDIVSTHSRTVVPKIRELFHWRVGDDCFRAMNVKLATWSLIIMR